MENYNHNSVTSGTAPYGEWVRAVPTEVFSSHKNKGGLSNEVFAVYENIRSLMPKQLDLFQSFLLSLYRTPSMKIYDADVVASSGCNGPSSTPAGRRVALADMQLYLEQLGFSLLADIGRIRYSEGFQALSLSYDICYVRHGRTEGNTEPRVFQGQVDYLSNFLNSIGQEQAVEAAARLKSLGTAEGWVPEVILTSPLTRAKQTALPYLMQRANDSVLSAVQDGLKEMAFGSWDNMTLGELPVDSIAHLFYLQQNVLVKSSQPHKVDVKLLPPCDCYHHKKKTANGGGDQRNESEIDEIPSENFVEVLSRTRATLLELNKHPLIEKAANRLQTQDADDKSSHTGGKVKVLMFGHSMSGAAVSILMGHGKCDKEGYLGFDGSYIMPNATPTFLPPNNPHAQ
eukprot:GHVS01029822.1.p1 GENE.GHVS01029822.1~~GHVS01029822.1.p1  ORF type:complete len:400 (+),score=58.56 GHVS01029822.1:313-1512(+)